MGQCAHKWRLGGPQGVAVVGVLEVPQTDPQQCSLGGHWAVRYRYHRDRKTWVSCCGTHGPANSNPTSPVHPCCRDAVLLVQSCISCVRIWVQRPGVVRGKSSLCQGGRANDVPEGCYSTARQESALGLYGDKGRTAPVAGANQRQRRSARSVAASTLLGSEPVGLPETTRAPTTSTGRQSIHGKAWTPGKTQVAVLTIARPKSGHGLHVIMPGHSRLLVSARRLGLGRSQPRT